MSVDDYKNKVRKRIYFIPPDKDESSGEESDDGEDFRISLRKKVKLERDEVKCKKVNTWNPLQP